MTYQRTPGIASQLTVPSYVSGRYYGPVGVLTTTRLTVSGTLYAFPFVVGSIITISRIGAEVTSAGAAGSTVRLGIYADSAGSPSGSPILDAGTIAGDSATAQEITVSQVLQPGVYWFASKAESSGTYPTMRAVGNAMMSVGGQTLVLATASNTNAYAPAGVATGPFGAFPATPTPSIASAPAVVVKIA